MSLDGCTDMSQVAARNLRLDMCTDMCLDMCADMCVDMCVDLGEAVISSTGTSIPAR